MRAERFTRHVMSLFIMGKQLYRRKMLFVKYHFQLYLRSLNWQLLLVSATSNNIRRTGCRIEGNKHPTVYWKRHSIVLRSKRWVTFFQKCPDLNCLQMDWSWTIHQQQALFLRVLIDLDSWGRNHIRTEMHCILPAESGMRQKVGCVRKWDASESGMRQKVGCGRRGRYRPTCKLPHVNRCSRRGN